MTKEEIEDNNLLIAKFIGFVFYPNSEDQFGKLKPHWGIPVGKPNPYKDLLMLGLTEDKFKFHSSWDWLMPVVEKIETLFNDGIDVNILSDGTIIEQCRDSDNEQLHNPVEIVRLTRAEIGYESKIEHTWLAVVEFIKWYNKNEKIQS